MEISCGSDTNVVAGMVKKSGRQLDTSLTISCMSFKL